MPVGARPPKSNQQTGSLDQSETGPDKSEINPGIKIRKPWRAKGAGQKPNFLNIGQNLVLGRFGLQNRILCEKTV